MRNILLATFAAVTFGAGVLCMYTTFVTTPTVSGNKPLPPDSSQGDLPNPDVSVRTEASCPCLADALSESPFPDKQPHQFAPDSAYGPPDDYGQAEPIKDEKMNPALVAAIHSALDVESLKKTPELPPLPEAENDPDVEVIHLLELVPPMPGADQTQLTTSRRMPRCEETEECQPRMPYAGEDDDNAEESTGSFWQMIVPWLQGARGESKADSHESPWEKFRRSEPAFHYYVF